MTTTAALLALSWAVPPSMATSLIEVANSGVTLNMAQDKPNSGAGIALIDQNADGLMDFVASGGWDQAPVLYRNLGDLMFAPVPAAESGLIDFGGDLRGFGVADYDNDGDPDIFVANWDPGGPQLLLRNDNGFFVDVADEAGVIVDGYGTTGTWADVNGDGWLDLYISRYYAGNYNHLFINQQDGTFVDTASVAGFWDVPDEPNSSDAHSFTTLWWDIDRDGDLDCYEVNDRCYGWHPRNFLWLNNGDGTFVEDAAQFGLDICMDGMGAALGDLDQDGFLDMFITNIHYGHVFLKRDCGGFTDVTMETGTAMYQWGWGVIFEDLDHNMWPDLFVAHQSLGSPGDITDRYLLNDGGVLTDVTDTLLQVEHGESFVVVRGDLDNDLDSDVIVGRVALGDPIRILRNEGPTGHALRVLLKGTETNRDGVGAIVEVFAGGLWQRQHRVESRTFGGRGDPALLFGLGPHETVDIVRVYWPSGASQQFTDVPGDTLLSVVELSLAQEAPPLWLERCGNDIDDDCDGETDEGFGVGGPCAAEIGGCAVGGSLKCTADGESTWCDPAAFDVPPEHCGNGQDDDCDGEIDEGLPAEASCTTGVGACTTTGNWVCDEGTGQPFCDAAPAPSTDELCGDGLDNDCDGDTDEGFGMGAACVGGLGACSTTGVLTCTADGSASYCLTAEAPAPGAELCGDTIDNDCDGDTDEGFEIGIACAAGLGACSAPGVTVCAEGGLDVQCAGDTGTPAEESCDQLDNDCDGLTDEDYDAGADCTMGLGACVATGTRVCTPDGGATACLASPGAPAEELCGDGIDNDCDGDTDEGFGVGQLCSTGVGACARPGLLACLPSGSGAACDADVAAPDAERCGDAIDNDCDGDTDEGFEIGGPCTAGAGACQMTGTVLCAANGYHTVCSAAPLPGCDADGDDGSADTSDTSEQRGPEATGDDAADADSLPEPPGRSGCHGGPVTPWGLLVCAPVLLAGRRRRTLLQQIHQR